MAKQRSPNCPTIALREALDRGRMVYAKEHTHPAARSVIAADLGFSGISGASATVIGALRQYGVLEGRGEEMRISEDALAAFELPADSMEYSAAIKRLAFHPALFGELHEQFGDRPPGEANLRHLLIKKRFLPDTADDVIRTYRENLEFIQSRNSQFVGAEEQSRGTVSDSNPARVRDSANPAPDAPSRPGGIENRSFCWPLSKDVTAEVRFSGAGALSSLHFERLRRYLELAKETWGDAIE